MEPHAPKQKQKFHFLTSKFRFLVLLLALVVIHPEPAHAQFVVTVATDVTAVANFIVSHALDLAEYAISHLQRAANSVTNVLSHMVATSAIGDFLNGISMGINRAAYMNSANNEVSARTVAPDTRLCPSRAMAASREQMHIATTAASGGAETASIVSRINSQTPAFAATNLIDECKKGFRDSSSSGTSGDLLQQAGCAATPPQVNGKSFIYADVMMSSLIDPYQYAVPAHATSSTDPKTGIVTLKMPDATNLSGSAANQELEEDYIAAYYYCQRWRPQLPQLPYGKGRPFTMDDLKIEAALDLMAKSEGAYKTCTNAMAKRTAVSTTAAALSSQFQQMNTAQVSACLQMHTLGILSDADYATCQTNGMSQLEQERQMAYKYGQDNYLKNLVGMKQMTPERVSELQETEGDRSITAFEQNLEMEKVGVAAALNGALNLPQGVQVNPSAHASGP